MSAQFRAFSYPMSTKQPAWQFVANLGDVNPLDYDGLFVYVDRSGVYAPECAKLERITDDSVTGSAERWQVSRWSLDRCTWINGVLSDNRFHPSKPAWFADKLASVADTNGITETELRAMLCASDPVLLARGYECLIGHFGAFEFDQYPMTLTRADVYRLYRKECFRSSVRRATGKRVSRSIPSGEVGPFARATV